MIDEEPICTCIMKTKDQIAHQLDCNVTKYRQFMKRKEQLVRIRKEGETYDC